MFSRGSSYRSYKSLSCWSGRVEKALRILPVFPLLFSSLALAEVGGEPEPWPNLDGANGQDYGVARKLLKERKWAEAAIILRSVLKKSSSESVIVLDLVRALAYSGRREEALSFLEQAISREKSAARKAQLRKRLDVISKMFLSNVGFQLYEDGLNLMHAGKYRPAREKFEKALEQEPDNVELLLREGQCLVLDRDEDSAAERLRLARKLNHYEPETHLWLGRAMHLRGELGEAIDELRIASKDLPTSERAAIWLADALAAAGQRQSAFRILEDDLDERPAHVAALLSLARLRSDDLSGGTQALWSARKNLQLVSSRIGEYLSDAQPRSEGVLGVEMRHSNPNLKEESEKLLESIETKLDAVSK